MSRTYGLNAYKVVLRAKYSKTPWTLKHKSKTDGFSELKGYLSSRKRLTAIPGTDKALFVRNIRAIPTELCIDGLVACGEAGAVQHLRDITTGKRTYTTSKQEAVMTPSYFRFQLEDNRPYGVLLVQTGPISTLGRDLSNFFDSLVDPLSVRLTQIVSLEALNSIAKTGALQKVVLINNGKSTSSRKELRSTSVGGKSLGAPGDNLQLAIKKAGGWKPKMLQSLLSHFKKNTLDQAVQSAGMSEYDELRVQVKVGNRLQTFSMSRPNETPLKFDITRDVKIALDGNPTIASLRNAAKQIYKHSIVPVL